jgi:hypothetical protein
MYQALGFTLDPSTADIIPDLDEAVSTAVNEWTNKFLYWTSQSPRKHIANGDMMMSLGHVGVI